ncbi:MAG: hypothetical protein EBQ92_00735, partial [Proteobacteria bacterium]|nr:hypothetical protein [Pseudomonadota bacterium]
LLSQTEPEPVLLPQTEPDAELDCIQARLRLKEIKRQIKEIKTMREEEIKDFTPKQRKEYNYLRRKFMNVHYARRRRAAKRKEKSKN